MTTTMENNTSYHGVQIVNDGDDMYPYYIPALALINADSDMTETTCRFRTLPAAKAAITRHLLDVYSETLHTAAMYLRTIANFAPRTKKCDMSYPRYYAKKAAENIEEVLILAEHSKPQQNEQHEI